MKDFINNLDLAIWIALIVGQLFLCLCALKKQLFRRLPLFTVFIFASAAETIFLFVIAFAASYGTYYRAFYVAGRIVSVSAFLTVIEFGRQVLPGLKLPQREKALGCLTAAICSIILFVSLWPVRSISNEKRIEIAGCLVVAVTFIFIAAYSRYLGLRWSRLLGGVAFTLGLLYLSDGIAKAVIGHYPSALVLKVRQLREIANVLAVLAWIVVVLSPWGESSLTDDILLKAQQIVHGAEAKFRDFALEASTKA
jgi:hypothetical protein